jgi:hypothetical protein
LREVPAATETALKQVFDFDKRIRFVILLKSDGKPFFVLKREHVTSLEPEEVTKQFFLRAIVAKGIVEQENKYHGKLKTVVLIREKVTLVAFMILDLLLLLSVEPGFPLSRVEKLGRKVDAMGLNLA